MPDWPARSWDELSPGGEGVARAACNRSPGYLELQHELARCDLRIGRASDGQGLHVEAIKAFGRAGSTFKRILDRSPGNMEIRREFAQCSTDQGDQLTKAGKIDEAITFLVMARDAFQALADSQPGNEPARSDLGANLVRLGFTLNEGGRIGEARDAYEHARYVLEPLVASSPAISDYQERLAETNYRLATVLRSLSRYEDSLAAATRARELNRTLADRHPSVADYRASQSLNECQISAYHRQLRQNDAAIDRAREAVANAERSARIDPTAERCKFALAISNDTLGRPLFNAKRYAEALSALEKSRVHWKVYEQTYPDNSYTRAGLPSTLLNIALSHQRLGQPASAVQALREADQSFERIAVMNPATLYNHAGIHGNLAELAHVAGSGLTPDDGQIEEERAMTLVSRAVAAGYRNARIMQNDDALAVLRKRTDFQALLADLSFPADPFAH